MVAVKPMDDRRHEEQRSIRRWLVLIFVVALVLRAWCLFEALRAPFLQVLLGDSLYYHNWATRIAAGDWLGDRVFWLDPLYAYFLALVYRCAGEGLLLPLAIQVLLGSVNCVLVFFVARRAFGEKTGLLAAILTALYKPLVFHDVLLLKTSLATFMCCGSLLCLLEAERRRHCRYWALAGLLVGLTCLQRANFLLFIPCVLLWAGTLPWPGGRRKAWPQVLSFCVAAGTLVLIVTLRNYIVGHDFVLLTSNAGHVFYPGNNPHNVTGTYAAPPYIRQDTEHDEHNWHRHAERALGRKLRPSEVSRFWFRKSFRWIVSDPVAYLRLLLRKVWLTWNCYEMPDNYNQYFFARYSRVLRAPLPGFGWVAPSALVGLLLSAGEWRRRLLLYLCLASSCASPIVFYVFARYRVPYVPLLCIFGAFAALRIIEWFRHGRARQAATGAAAVVCLAIFVNIPTPHEDDTVRQYFNLGTIYESQGNLDAAIKAYQQALELDPSLHYIHNNLGSLYSKDERYPKAEREARAEAEFRKAIDCYAEDDLARRNLALCYWRQGRHDEALAELRRAAQLNPDHQGLLRRLTARAASRE